jgi:hypothetical protein
VGGGSVVATGRVVRDGGGATDEVEGTVFGALVGTVSGSTDEFGTEVLGEFAKGLARVVYEGVADASAKDSPTRYRARMAARTISTANIVHQRVRLSIDPPERHRIGISHSSEEGSCRALRLSL